MNSFTPVSSVGERELIRRLSRIFYQDSNRDVLIGPGKDDCAVLSAGDGECIVVTTDMLHRTTDFPQQMSGWQIGWMSAAVNLSDIAAMGANPCGILAAIGLQSDCDVGFVEEIARGLHACAASCGTSVIGGDIDTHDELTITGTAVGKVSEDRLLTRKGAKPGDMVCVTGYAGSAGAALYALENNIETSESLLKKLFEPIPRVRESLSLADSGAVTSMMDTSDGIAISLYDLADASDVGFIIYEDRLPLQDDLKQLIHEPERLLDYSLYSGGDFELLFTLSPEKVSDATKTCDFTIIGKVAEKDMGITLERPQANNLSISRKGYLQLKDTD
ncbi:thiamine-monophosphate kinase [Methanosalsum zhilinae DSM 4017]|uniref:Thiamine-monophosphate kinase n=1 Tax=Methanosalsum zhilinae (strain DSM 4017 / NBRC 107636 / OCM 62 / WeN5) TaxID=679901 RepID=F7XNX2_METZD|nr:thiamine-phosphate kinase [Methanosalsum zhilinae]AEH60162.1 thiamine-monophosphate kinase [Methanosalsum zhilinae DSM 4017]